jgi:hypothetical protein
MFRLGATLLVQPGSCPYSCRTHGNAPTNAPVLWGFFGSPFNDKNPNDVVMTPLATGVGERSPASGDAPEGNGTTLAAQLPNILSGHSYINFHTMQFGGGRSAVRSWFLNRQRCSCSAPERLASSSVGGGGRPAPGETPARIKGPKAGRGRRSMRPRTKAAD